MSPVEAAEHLAAKGAVARPVRLSQPVSSSLLIAVSMLVGAVLVFAGARWFAPAEGEAGFTFLLVQEFALLVAVVALVWGLVAGLQSPVTAPIVLHPDGLDCGDGEIIHWWQFDQLFIEDGQLIAQIERDPQAAIICRLEAVAGAEAEFGRGNLYPDPPLERALLLAAADEGNPYLDKLALPLGEQAGQWAGLLRELQHRIAEARATMVASDPVQVQAIRAFIGMNQSHMELWRQVKRSALAAEAPQPPKHQLALLWRMGIAALGGQGKSSETAHARSTPTLLRARLDHLLKFA